MELILRIADSGAMAHDVIVGLDRHHTVAELACAMAEHVGAPQCDRHAITVVRTGRTLLPDAAIGDVDLLSGDELRLGSAGLSPIPGLPRRAVTADVLAGPESGRSLVMLPGRYRIGRSADCDLSIDDPSVSRHHADVEYTTDGRVVLHPMPDTSNGITVNDAPVEVAIDVSGDDVVALGGTRLGFRPFERSLDEHVDRLGQLDFHRTPYRPPIVATRDDEVLGPIPERPEPRRLQALAMLAPLAGGLAMYAFSRQPQFLALTAVSPLVMVANVVEARRSGRTTFGAQLGAFTARIGEHRRRLDVLRHSERIERHRAAPDLADLSRRAELRTVDLWPRGRDSPDFLRVRLGLGTTHVAYGIDLDRGGDDDLRDELRAVIGEFDHIDNVPVSIDLLGDPVLGIHGEQRLVDGVVASLAAQAATLHSPEDLTIVAAIAPDRPFGWLKWLPHVRSVASPLPGDHVVQTRDDASAVVSRLVEVATFRTAGARRDDVHRVWPRILLIIDGSLAPDPVEVSRLLEIGPAAGIAVIWTASSLAGIPRQAAQVLDVRPGEGAAMLGHIWSTDPDLPARSLEVEHLRSTRADLVARALAPVRDASTASLATSIPRTAPLLDVLGVGRPTARWVTEQWSRATGYELRFPIGLAADGPLEIDLVENGPHSLIGGTSGAGKSELLQSMVAALAVRHPPTRLNFLFVDYKGGASSKVLERLPHTVGYVTNLSADLSIRALVSLRAELNRRMQVMEGIAKDLDEMLEIAPELAPPSLVIVVDEFATLVKEVPEFVAGVVDIAQRGRSLGIHLVLATQRPSGSVNENILANTNLRMSLRMLDRTESSSIIDSPDAADIPVPLKGRGFVRLGPRELIEFQSSFAGAPLVSGETRTPVLVAPFDRTDDSPRATSPGGAGCEPRETHLSVLLDAISAANEALAYAAPRRPWREVLDPVVVLANVAEGPGTDPTREYPGRYVTFGMLDAPETQEQRPAVVDLEDGGGWLVFGSGGSGKTTLLRTIAASISQASRGDDVAIIGFDFGSRGLTTIKPLPEVVDVATGDDLEAVTRHLATLDAELTRRRRLLGDLGAEHLTAYNRLARPLPRIVLLIDGFGGLASTFLGSSGAAGMSMEQWGDIVQRLVIDGRQVGIHAVITADRANAVPSRLHSAIGNRLILRHADRAAYADYGISGDRAGDLGPGRGLVNGSTLVQVASVSSDTTARGQADMIASIARHAGRAATSALGSVRLPTSVSLDDLPAGSNDVPGDALRPCLGVADLSGDPIVADLEYSNLVVCGTPRSGRSTTLCTVAISLAPNHDLTAVGPAASPLANLDPDLGVEIITGRPDRLVQPLERLAAELFAGPSQRPRILIVDDADLLDDVALVSVMERLVAADGLRIVAAMETRSMTGYTQSPLVNALRRSRRLLVLRPDDPSDFLTTTGVKLSLRPGIDLPPGRGVLLADRVPTTMQVAHC